MNEQERWISICVGLKWAHDFEVHQTAHVPPRFQSVVTLVQGIEPITLSGAGPTILEALEAALLRGSQ